MGYNGRNDEIRDNDGAYGHVFIGRLKAMGIHDRPISRGSPWQNDIAERLIGTLRHGCPDHVVVFGERHLRGVLFDYAAYYIEHGRIGRSRRIRLCGERSSGSVR